MVIMPDASRSHVVNNLVGASVGAAGQRCMGISVAVFVGQAKDWVEDIKAGFANVRPGVWDDKDAALWSANIDRSQSAYFVTDCTR